MPFKPATLLLLVALAGAPSTQPSSQPSSQPGEFDRALEAIDRRAHGIQDLIADFVQEKRSPLLRKPLVSRGTVRAKGALALWVTTEPEPMRMTIGPDAMRLYFPKQKVIEEYPMHGQLGMMAASPLPRLKAIRENFRMKPDGGAGLAPATQQATDLRAVRMEPIDQELAKYLDHTRVLLDADRGVMLAFEMIDPDGEHTTIRFSNIRVNTGLTDDSLQLDAPPGTRTVRPAAGAMPSR